MSKLRAGSDRVGDAGERRLQRAGSARRRHTSAMTSASGVPSSTSWTPGTRTSPTIVTITVPAESGGPQRAIPRGAAGEDVRRRRQRLDVVDEGRVARLAGPAGVPASQPIVTVANRPCCHGGSRRGSGSRPSITSSSAFSSPNRYSSGPSTIEIVKLAEQPGVAELDGGAAQVGDLDAERALDADVGRRGVDAEGGDGEALDDAIRDRGASACGP